MKIYAAIEAGGTKFNCAIFDENRNKLDSIRLDTTTPDETLSWTIDFFQAQRDKGMQFEALGVASFGPLDLDKRSPTYGYITATPKPNWSNIDLIGPLADALNCPVALDTDVNGAGLAEYTWGAGQNCESLVYITVGTGLGGGVIINGKPLHGLVHPEIGHMLLPKIDGVTGHCPFHENCAEGYAAGRSMEHMWGQPAHTFEPSHPAWTRQVEVLAQVCHNLLVSLSPQKIIMGGGVMAQSHLLPRVIEATSQSLHGYLTLPPHLSISDVIVPPQLGDISGLFGAFALAKNIAPA